jgi:hypothetical protein
MVEMGYDKWECVEAAEANNGLGWRDPGGDFIGRVDGEIWTFGSCPFPGLMSDNNIYSKRTNFKSRG